MIIKRLKRLLLSNKLKFTVATVLILYILIFSNIPTGFSYILHASDISGVDEEGRFLYMHGLEDEEVFPSGDFSVNRNFEPADFETEIHKNIYSFDLNDDFLILVNKDHPLLKDVDCELKNYNGFDVDERIYDSLQEMMKDAKNDGINLFISSGYRNYNTQSYLYEKKINYFKRLGYSKEEAIEIASKKVTPPLTSEHETGLAVDILSYGHDIMDQEFGESEAGVWLRENCFKYGFILRYPKGAEDITKIQYEPWHFRYVGKDAAEFIYINNLTFEEFYELILEYNESEKTK